MRGNENDSITIIPRPKPRRTIASIKLYHNTHRWSSFGDANNIVRGEVCVGNMGDLGATNADADVTERSASTEESFMMTGCVIVVSLFRFGEGEPFLCHEEWCRSDDVIVTFVGAGFVFC